MTKPNGGTAFPHADALYEAHKRDAGYHGSGMSLRDYFAAQALPVVMKASDIQDVLAWSDWSTRVAAASYEVADAMIAERVK